MDIEEAIDILTQKEIIDLSNHFNNTRFFEAIYTLLTAYEKQSKEIEELKDMKKELTERVLRLESDKFWDNVVSKDKIKAKTIEIKNRPAKDEFITASQGKLNTIIDMESLL